MARAWKAPRGKAGAAARTAREKKEPKRVKVSTPGGLSRDRSQNRSAPGGKKKGRGATKSRGRGGAAAQKRSGRGVDSYARGQGSRGTKDYSRGFRESLMNEAPVKVKKKARKKNKAKK